MTIRKVQIAYRIVDHNKRTDAWYDMRRNARHEIIDKLERDFGFKATGSVNSVATLFGWLDSSRFEEVRALPEIVLLSDDYPYLIQKSEERPEWTTPHPYVMDALLEDPSRASRQMRDRQEKKIVRKK